MCSWFMMWEGLFNRQSIIETGFNQGFTSKFVHGRIGLYMADKNNRGGVNGSLTNKIIGGVILVAVIIVIILVSREKNDGISPVDETVSTAEATENSGALEVVQPIQAGDYEYAFQGVKWIFDTESVEVAGTGQTWLKMEFADFTRNGNTITFGRPYKLGVHAGECSETDFIDTTSENGIPFAYATCEGAGVKREFVVLQENENVVVKMRETKAGVDSVWKEWYKINVTEIVR